MAKFKALNTKKYFKTKTEITPDYIYWKQLETPTFVKEFGAIDYIDFSPIDPFNFAVTCSVRVQIYNPITKLVVKNLSRFQETAYGGTFRKDGRLLIAGDEQGFVKLFDTNSKNVLRLFKGHRAPVHRVNFTSDLLHVVSYSDDKTVRLWDVATEKSLHTFNEHTDYIRAGTVNPLSPHVVVSGGYDSKIIMYDTRTNQSTFTVDHGAPVESLLFLPTGGIFLSAGGTEVRVWDAFSGCRLMARLSQHHKTVTCLRLGSNGKRILSGGLDKHVKIYDVATYRTVHTLDFPSPILSLGIAPNDSSVVVGMVDGMVSIQNMTVNQAQENITRLTKKSRKRYTHSTPKPTVTVDHAVAQENRDKVSTYDKHLRNYEYVKCLTEVMKSRYITRTPEVTVSVMQELIHRKGLQRALVGRTNAFLSRLITFIRRHISEHRFMRVLIDVGDTLLDAYEDKFDEFTGHIGKEFIQLAETVQQEVMLTYELLELEGMVELLLDTCAATQQQEHESEGFEYVRTNAENSNLKQSALAKDVSILTV